MKKIFAVILLFTLLFNFTGCQESDNPSSEENHVVTVIEAIPFPDIKINIPSDYEKTSSEYIDEFYKKGNASVIVTSKLVSDSQKNMESIVYDALTQYQQIADDFTEVSSEEMEIKDCESRIVEVRYSIRGENSSLNMSCCFGFIIGKTNLYIITCSVPTSEYSKYSDEFKEIIKSACPLG